MPVSVLEDLDEAEVLARYGAKARQAAAVVANRAGLKVKDELIEIGHQWLRDHAAEIVSWPGTYKPEKIDKTLYLSMYRVMRDWLFAEYGARVAMPGER